MSEQHNQPSAKYIVHHAEGSAIGDYAMVNNHFGPAQAQADPAVAELRQLFTRINEQLATLEPADRDMIAPAVAQTVEAAAAIQAGDASEAKQSFLAKRLKSLYAMAPDIGEVIITSLANPALGIALTLRKIAQKAQAELASKSSADTAADAAASAATG